MAFGFHKEITAIKGEEPYEVLWFEGSVGDEYDKVSITCNEIDILREGDTAPLRRYIRTRSVLRCFHFVGMRTTEDAINEGIRSLIKDKCTTKEAATQDAPHCGNRSTCGATAAVKH